jgi:hypothetical protein
MIEMKVALLIFMSVGTINESSMASNHPTMEACVAAAHRYIESSTSVNKLPLKIMCIDPEELDIMVMDHNSWKWSTDKGNQPKTK